MGPARRTLLFLVSVFFSSPLVLSGPEPALRLSDPVVSYVRTAHAEGNISQTAVILLGLDAMPVCIFHSLEEPSGRRVSSFSQLCGLMDGGTGRDQKADFHGCSRGSMP